MSVSTYLGVDPGSRLTGWAFISQEGRHLAVVDSGVIRLRPTDALWVRLGALQERIEALLCARRPDAVAVEDIFTAKNVKSALSLGHARGVILAAAGRQGLEVFAYPPATVKRAVCGHGRADKTQIQKMVQVLLGTVAVASSDESDAMAIAICHALCRRAVSARQPAAARKAASR